MLIASLIGKSVGFVRAAAKSSLVTASIVGSIHSFTPQTALGPLCMASSLSKSDKNEGTGGMVSRSRVDPFDLAWPFENFPLRSLNLEPPMGMQMDTKETKTSYELQIDLPGVEKKDIVINMEGDLLTITAEKKGMEKDDDHEFKRVERFTGTMTRTISLPDNTDKDKVQADFTNGVLHVTIPKLKEDVKKPKKTVQVK